MLTNDFKVLKNATFVSTFYMEQITSFQNWHVELARKSFMPLVCINGFQRPIILHVHCVETFSNQKMKYIKHLQVLRNCSLRSVITLNLDVFLRNYSKYTIFLENCKDYYF